MLDPSIISDRPESVRRMLKARGVEFDLDALVRAEKRVREMLGITGQIRAKKNRAGREISRRKKLNQDAAGPLQEMKTVSEELQAADQTLARAESEYRRLALTVPNLVDDSVPVGDESANREVRRWGDIPEFEFAAKNHIDISNGLGIVDIERAAKVSGARFYYLKGGLVRLNQALISYALDFLSQRGYAPIQPPYMISRQAMEGAVITDDFEEVIYKIQDEDLYMIGTSEHAMAAMHSGEILDGKSLPIRYAGVSPCFRKEAGAHGRDQKGIFRVHQFDKIEQFVFARPEDSWAEHERMLGVAEEFYRELGIPHRVVLLSSGDMGKVSAKTYDIEAWMAGQGAYREVVSCSNCLDYQARRLKTRFRDSTDAATRHTHTLNSTLVATTRVLVSIIENRQTKDGRIGIPGVLQKYMGGSKEI